MNGEWVRNYKETVVVNFNMLLRYLSGLSDLTLLNDGI